MIPPRLPSYVTCNTIHPYTLICFLFFSLVQSVTEPLNIYTNLIELIESLSNSDQYKCNHSILKREQYWNTTLSALVSFSLPTSDAPAIRCELPDRHITANKSHTKHPLLMHERHFDPGQTRPGKAVITVPQTTTIRSFPLPWKSQQCGWGQINLSLYSVSLWGDGTKPGWHCSAQKTGQSHLCHLYLI